MKNYLMILLIVACINQFSCSKEKSELDNGIRGTWIRADYKKDTIIFGYKENDNWFELKRGFQMINGKKMPITPFGLYKYKIDSNKISIQWVASSSTSENKYHFIINNDEIIIGNFIDTIASTITLNKIK